MKTEIIEMVEDEVKIDWSKSQLVKTINKNRAIYILTNGLFDNSNLNVFSGIVIHSSDNGYKVGHYKNDWLQSTFTPITEPITFKFNP